MANLLAYDGEIIGGGNLENISADNVLLNNSTEVVSLSDYLQFPTIYSGQTEIGLFTLTKDNNTYEVTGIKIYLWAKQRYAIIGTCLSGDNIGKFVVYNSQSNTFIIL